MTRISFLRPTDQFQGKQRFLQEMKQCLASDDYQHMRLAVAFAKSGPLLRLLPLLREWRRSEKTIEGIIGIDHYVTTKQALEIALESFDRAYITHVRTQSSMGITFHPKLYLFYGTDHAVCFYGSQNLTVGGTETNLEGGVKIEFDLPEDDASWQEALSCWTSLLPDQCPMTRRLDTELLDSLFQQEMVCDERSSRSKSLRDVHSPEEPSEQAEPLPELFPVVRMVPPSPIPKGLFSPPPRRTPAKKAPKKSPAKSTKRPRAEPPPLPTPVVVSAEAMVIEIVPPSNNEVRLSKGAIDQNPDFFGFPFTGSTVPKKPGTSENPRNRPYPQRTPDPTVQTTVYDVAGESIRVRRHALNMVLYEGRGELRITFPAGVLNDVARYSLMVMRRAVGPYDYDIDIFNPGSQTYLDYLGVCNQTLPSGGANRARRMGWL